MLDKGQIAKLLDAADLIDDWLGAVRAHALHLAESGSAIPGYKLVPKRATRKWREDASIYTVSGVLGVDLADVQTEPKLKSPAQVEKLVPKDRREKMADLVVKESSGSNLVKDSDPRKPATPSAIADFSGVV